MASCGGGGIAASHYATARVYNTIFVYCVNEVSLVHSS